MFEENLKNKKKDLLNIDNIHGKNLMQRFEEMSEKIVFEEKNKNRVSSVENEIKSYSKTKNMNKVILILKIIVINYSNSPK